MKSERSAYPLAGALLADEHDRPEERSHAPEDDHRDRDAQGEDPARDGGQAEHAHHDPADAVGPAERERLAVGERREEQRGVDRRMAALLA